MATKQPVTIEQSLLNRRMALEAKANGCSEEFIELLIGMLEYYQLRENYLMSELKKQWGL